MGGIKDEMEKIIIQIIQSDEDDGLYDNENLIE